MYINYIIGPAGSGKTTLTKALQDYISTYNQEISVITINLDPAVQNLPYKPDIDIQDYITVNEVIQETGLGPNGAMIAATDRMVDYIEDLKYEINQYNDPEIVLIDTPGQMELFSFRNSGPMIANALGFGSIQRGIIFCYDSLLCGTPNGMISTLLLAASVQFRFANLPQLNLLTKKDLLSMEKLERILSWMENDLTLMDAIESLEHGVLREYTVSLARAFIEFGATSELLPVSAKYNEGVDQVYGKLQQIMNDDTSPYY
ncbi:MAG: ATP/GTP-binding protein [Candidatus Lokiarchaeota archaeon]|nr:ATP/GTP-binding protein [Candidatus Harpocratesius repetitus]